MKKFIILSFLFLSACGIQAPSAIKRLFPPGAVKIVFNSGTSSYTITFQGLNPETFFSGYNLYYTTNSAAAAIGSGTKVVRINTSSTDPTFVVNSPFFTVSNFTFTLDNNNTITNNIFGSGTPIISPFSFHWFIRAYSVSEALESPYSLTVQTE